MRVYVGHIIHCDGAFSLETFENGFVVVDNQKILACGEHSVLDQTLEALNVDYAVLDRVQLKSSQLLIPGLIDTHIHAPQYPNAGLGYDKPLLEWLLTYTYPLEAKYKDQDLAKKVFDALVRKSLDHGTTTACYFASLFENTCMLLVNSALEYGQRAFIGKINMTKLAPENYTETPQESIESTIKFVQDVRKRDSNLVQPIITPRFALSVDLELMNKLGAIAREYDLHIQTHISENTAEIEEVRKTYKPLSSYAEVYEKSNILTPKTVLAHGVHLTDEELKLISKRGSSISHCPESNTCLKSGRCDVRRLISAGIKVGLGTDISGGPSPSIVRAMRSALDVSIHIAFSKNNYTPLTYSDAFYLATLGGAEALALQGKIGNFEAGKDFDALLIDMDIENGNTDYLLEYSPAELLQKFIYTGDDRNIINVFVAGKRVK